MQLKNTVLLWSYSSNRESENMKLSCYANVKAAFTKQLFKQNVEDHTIYARDATVLYKYAYVIITPKVAQDALSEIQNKLRNQYIFPKYFLLGKIDKCACSNMSRLQQYIQYSHDKQAQLIKNIYDIDCVIVSKTLTVTHLKQQDYCNKKQQKKLTEYSKISYESYANDSVSHVLQNSMFSESVRAFYMKNFPDKTASFINTSSIMNNSSNDMSILHHNTSKILTNSILLDSRQKDETVSTVNILQQVNLSQIKQTKSNMKKKEVIEEKKEEQIQDVQAGNQKVLGQVCMDEKIKIQENAMKIGQDDYNIDKQQENKSYQTIQKQGNQEQQKNKKQQPKQTEQVFNDKQSKQSNEQEQNEQAEQVFEDKQSKQSNEQQQIGQQIHQNIKIQTGIDPKTQHKTGHQGQALNQTQQNIKDQHYTAQIQNIIAKQQNTNQNLAQPNTVTVVVSSQQIQKIPKNDTINKQQILPIQKKSIQQKQTINSQQLQIIAQLNKQDQPYQAQNTSHQNDNENEHKIRQPYKPIHIAQLFQHYDSIIEIEQVKQQYKTKQQILSQFYLLNYLQQYNQQEIVYQNKNLYQQPKEKLYNKLSILWDDPNQNYRVANQISQKLKEQGIQAPIKLIPNFNYEQSQKVFNNTQTQYIVICSNRTFSQFMKHSCYPFPNIKNYFVYCMNLEIAQNNNRIYSPSDPVFITNESLEIVDEVCLKAREIYQRQILL